MTAKLPGHNNARNFSSIFGANIMDFWSTIHGFDIVKFDTWLRTPDGTSTRDYIVEKYSEEASDFVESLI